MHTKKRAAAKARWYSGAEKIADTFEQLQ